MSVTVFQDFPLADRDGSWGWRRRPEAVEAVRGGRGRAQREVPRRARLERQGNKDNFTAYKLLIADVVDEVKPCPAP